MNVGWLETSFPVNDIGVTRAWYEKLGFQPVSTADAGRSVTMQAGECRVALYEGVLDPAASQLIFWQGDVEGCAEALDQGRNDTRAASEDQRRGRGRVHGPGPRRPASLCHPQNGVTKHMPAASGPDLDRGFCQVSLPVKDPERTAAFYELLGFHRNKVDPFPDERVAPLTNGECRICLYQGYLDPDELQLNFWQGDIDAIAAVVRREGLGFYREPGRDEKGAGFMLTDPDGRPVFFINMAKYTARDFVSESGEMLA